MKKIGVKIEKCFRKLKSDQIKKNELIVYFFF